MTFRPTGLLRRRILAERTPEGVRVWYEGDDMKSLYRPDTTGYEKWAALADEHAKEAADGPLCAA